MHTSYALPLLHPGSKYLGYDGLNIINIASISIPIKFIPKIRSE